MWGRERGAEKRLPAVSCENNGEPGINLLSHRWLPLFQWAMAFRKPDQRFGVAQREACHVESADLRILFLRQFQIGGQGDGMRTDTFHQERQPVFRMVCDDQQRPEP